MVIDMINKEIKVIYKSGLVREYDLKSFLSFSQLTINDLCDNNKLREQGIKEVKLINNPFSSLDLSLIDKTITGIKNSLNGLYEGIRQLDIYSSLDDIKLRMVVYDKAMFVYSVITEEGIKDVVFVNQGKDSDSLCCSYLLREYLKELKIDCGLDFNYDKQVFYSYKGTYNITCPLTNYLTEEDIFSFSSDKLYIFCDNGLSEEAIKQFNIKYYVAFDNHTHHLINKSAIEENIIEQDLGARNFIGATQEAMCLVDLNSYGAIETELFASCDSANLGNHYINKSKKQLDSLGLNIKPSYSKLDIGSVSVINGFFSTDKPEYQHLMPQGKFCPTKQNSCFLSFEPMLENINITKEKVIEKVIKKLKQDMGFEFRATDQLIIYNDNERIYGGLNVNVLVYRASEFKEEDKIKGFYFF